MAQNRRLDGLTLIEFLAVIAIICVLASMLLPSLARPRHSGGGFLSCFNNLKQVGVAYRVWANDNGDRFPSFTAETGGGWNDYLSHTDAGTYCWTNYAVMANEMGQSPRIVTCPSDVRKPADDFTNLANTNVSYFVGIVSNASFAHAILAGDRNLGPGTIPDPQFGFSPANGRGNDVLIKGPICWSQKTHSRGNPAGVGNILMADGSVQQTTSAAMRDVWIKSALADLAAHNPATNSPGLRLVFP